MGLVTHLSFRLLTLQLVSLVSPKYLLCFTWVQCRSTSAVCRDAGQHMHESVTYWLAPHVRTSVHCDRVPPTADRPASNHCVHYSNQRDTRRSRATGMVGATQVLLAQVRPVVAVQSQWAMCSICSESLSGSTYRRRGSLPGGLGGSWMAVGR